MKMAMEELTNGEDREAELSREIAEMRHVSPPLLDRQSCLKCWHDVYQGTVFVEHEGMWR